MKVVIPVVLIVSILQPMMMGIIMKEMMSTASNMSTIAGVSSVVATAAFAKEAELEADTLFVSGVLSNVKH